MESSVAANYAMLTMQGGGVDVPNAYGLPYGTMTDATASLARSAKPAVW